MQSLRATSEADCVASCAREVLDAAPILIWYIRRHMRKQRKGLSVPQFRALVKVRKEPGVSLSSVAEHLGASLPTTSRVVAKLVMKGFLERREGSEDRRQVLLEITAAGRSLVDAATASTQAHMEKDLASLSKAQREHVRRAMRILTGILESAGIAAAAAESRAQPARSEHRNGDPGREKKKRTPGIQPA